MSVRSLDIARPTLNDVFLRLTGRTIRAEDAGNERLRRSCVAVAGGPDAECRTRGEGRRGDTPTGLPLTED